MKSPPNKRQILCFEIWSWSLTNPLGSYSVYTHVHTVGIILIIFILCTVTPHQTQAQVKSTVRSTEYFQGHLLRR